MAAARDPRPITVAHVITSVGVGGAETALLRLLEQFDPTDIRSLVLSFRSGGQYEGRVKALGATLVHLDEPFRAPQPGDAAACADFDDSQKYTVHPRSSDLLLLSRLRRALRALRPDVVQTWMYHPNLLGGLAAVGTGIPVIWNLRNSTRDLRHSSPLAWLSRQAGARVSRRLPAAIVCCAEAARQLHVELGYPAERMVVIPNGVPLPEPGDRTAARLELRAELGLARDTPLVCLVGRYDPQKDHHNYLAAAARVRAVRPDVQFLACGMEVDTNNAELRGWIDELGLADGVRLLGYRSDVPRILAGLDVLCSASYGEAFPNAVAEAMGVGTPCAVTDVGDSALMVADTGTVVPPRDPEALATAVLGLLALPAAEREALGVAARRRVEEHFSLATAAQRYAALWRTHARRD